MTLQQLKDQLDTLLLNGADPSMPVGRSDNTKEILGIKLRLDFLPVNSNGVIWRNHHKPYGPKDIGQRTGYEAYQFTPNGPEYPIIQQVLIL